MGNNGTELLGSYWTLAGGAYPHTEREYSPFDFRDRVEMAARAGFTGIGLWYADLAHVLKQRSLMEMKQILDDNGIRHVELEFLTDWFMEPGERRRKSDRIRKMLLTAADVLDARHIKVGDFYREPCPMTRLIDSFAELCFQAADHGTDVLYEFMPFANINTLDDAIALLEGAGAANSGVMLDLWHIIRLDIPYEELRRIPSQYLRGVELNDGKSAAPEDLHDATVNHRQLCGEGEFDIKGFIACLRDLNYQGPYGIEVLSAELRELPMEELFTRAFDTTIAQFRG